MHSVLLYYVDHWMYEFDSEAVTTIKGGKGGGQGGSADGWERKNR